MAENTVAGPGAHRSRRSTALLGVIALLASLLATVATPSIASAAPAAPTGLSPDLASVAGNPQITWDAVPDAVDYDIQISSSNTFSPLLYNISTVNTTFTPYNQLPTGTIYYRVRVNDDTGTGPFANAQFDRALSGPTPSSPADGAVLDFPASPPTFAWDPLSNAVSYRLEVDDDEFFTSPQTFVTYSTTFTQFDPQVPGNTYYWRVRGATGKNGLGELSEWSPTQSYEYTWTTQPVLISPLALDVVTDVELVWEPVIGAARYDLQVSKSSDFSGNFEVDLPVYSTHFSPYSTFDNGAYYWRVRPRDFDNNLGTWSATGSFIRGWATAPTLTAPSNGGVALDPLRFSWSAVDRATHYEVQVGDDPNFSPNTYQSCRTLHTSIMDYSGDTTGTPGSCSIWNSASYAGVYGLTRYWRVRGIDENTNVNGLWSPIWSFTRHFDNPDTGSYSPADNATVSVPTLSWDPVVDADEYRVVIYKNAGATKVVDDFTEMTSYTPIVALDPADSPFRWYVISIESGHPAVTPSSLSWYDFTLVAPTTSASPQPLTPTFGASSGEMPSMSWTATTGADRYDIYYGNAGSGIFNATPLVANVRNTAYTHDVLLPAGSYDWYVQAKNGSTPVATGSVSRFELTTFAAASFVSPEDCPPLTPCTVLTSSPEIEWTPVPGAGAYYVYLAFDENFTNLVRTYRVPQAKFIMREELPDNDAGQAYYWHVRACRGGYPSTLNGCGPDPQGVSPPRRAFQKRSAPVLLTSPADAATVSDQVRFEWQDYQSTNPSDIEAEDYRIQVSTAESFSTTIDDRTVDQPFFTAFAETYPEGQLYWRVRAIDGSGNQLTWSETRSLTKSAPALNRISPVPDAALPSVPTFVWDPQPFAAAYVVEIAKNGDLNFSGPNRKDLQVTAFSQYTPRVSLPVGWYAWRIRRDDGQGKDGPWTPGRLFQITGAAPTLTSPNEGAYVDDNNVVFTWGGVANALTYRYERSDTPSFTSIKENRVTVMSAWAPISPIPNGTWYWRVTAYDADNVPIGTSEVRTFTRVAALPSAPRLATVTNGPGRITLSWLPPSNPGDPAFSKYKVTLEPGGVAMTLPTTQTSITFNGLNNGQVYTLTVRAATNDVDGPLVTRTGTPNGCVGTPFSDVAASHPFCEEIAWLSTEGISTGSTLGDGTKLYKPADAVTRQAMAAFLYRFAGEPAVGLSQPFFADVPATHPFFNAIQWMAESGLSTGSPQPSGKPLYKPTDAVSRMAMAAFLHRYAGSPAPGLFSGFADVPVTHPFYVPIQWMGSTGLSTGTPQPPLKPLYKPAPAVSRQAMAAFLYRFNLLLP